MTAETAAANKELVRRFYKEVYVEWNMALADEVVSPRFTSHDWPEGGPTGPQAFRDYYSAIRSAVPDARYEVDDLIAEGDRVVVRWRLLGTHEGDFRGIAPTGRAIALKGILAGFSSCIVPKATWHQTTAREPCSLLFITPGKGTRHRE